MGRSVSDFGHERRTELVVVALPDPGDPVRLHSSEKEPHLTLLYLGDPKFTPSELTHITEYIEHAASQLNAFGLDVLRRGELGDSQADVVFFDKRWTQEIAAFRNHLLKDELISSAYLSTSQFPEWEPHLTMGYPDTPAKKDWREYGQYSWIGFDRIALWTGNSTGATFQLGRNDPVQEVGMSQFQSDIELVNDILVHHGVKGMKWGVRRSSTSTSSDPDSDDVAAVKASKAKISKNRGKTDSLSNKDLQELVNRMNLEQQYSKIKKDSKPINKGNKKIQEILNKSKTLNDVVNFINSPAGKVIRKAVTGI
jgi:2'-5' RNA ligase